MGIYTTLASGDQIGEQPRVGLDRSSGEQLLSKAYGYDPDVGSAYAAADEVAVFPEQTDAGAADTYTLTINFPTLGVSVTTAAIAYNAVDTVIEGAIDTASDGTVPSWTNGDISVSMGGSAGLDDGTVTLTFVGASVTETPAVVTLTPTGFTATGGAVRNFGSAGRPAAQALFELNVISGTLWGGGEAPVGLTRPASNGQTRPRWDLIRSLALEAAAEDGTDDIYDAVVALYPRA